MADDAIKAFQAAQAALVDALQQDYFCDDLQPPSFAFGWSAEDFKQFYESGWCLRLVVVVRETRHQARRLCPRWLLVRTPRSWTS